MPTLAFRMLCVPVHFSFLFPAFTMKSFALGITYLTSLRCTYTGRHTLTRDHTNTYLHTTLHSFLYSVTKLFTQAHTN